LEAKGFKPMHYRYFCANAHYKSKLNFTWDALKSAKISYNRLIDLLQSHKTGSEPVDTQRYLVDFTEAVEDDLNIPKALGVLWNMVRSPQKSKDIYNTAMFFDEVFGLKLNEIPMADIVKSDVMDLINQRQKARERSDYTEADRIRDVIRDMNIILEDTKDGVKWKRS